MDRLLLLVANVALTCNANGACSSVGRGRKQNKRPWGFPVTSFTLYAKLTHGITWWFLTERKLAAHCKTSESVLPTW